MEPATTMNWNSQQDGNCLISTGYDWLQTSSNRTFVQGCYPALFEECQRNFDVGIQGIFLLGTPGVGKSCFLDYALHKFLQNGKSVLYLLGPSEMAVLFRSDFTIEGHTLTSALDHNKANDVDVVLYDPHAEAINTGKVHISTLCGKPFIVGLSPDYENCKKLRKDTNNVRLYMGTLSLLEAEAMRSTCYPHVTRQLLQRRYAKIGGVARHLFKCLGANNVDGALDEVEQHQLAALDDVVEVPRRVDRGEVASPFKHLWSLYHLQPGSTADGGARDYYHFTIELCCDDARIWIRDMLMEKNVNDLWSVYVDTLDNYGTLRGIRYEAYVHKKIIVEGLQGIASSLTDVGIGDDTCSLPIDIPSSLPKITLLNNDIGELLQEAMIQASDEGGYLIPHQWNFPLVHSLVVPSNFQTNVLLFQMKAGQSKPLSVDPASTIYDTTGGHFIFVVPDESIVMKKAGYSGRSGGQLEMSQYRIVVKENY
jgi:hypothetical protein